MADPDIFKIFNSNFKLIRKKIIKKSKQEILDYLCLFALDDLEINILKSENYLEMFIEEKLQSKELTQEAENCFNYAEI